MRIEEEFKRLLIENIAGTKFRWIALDKYRFSCRAFEYYAYSQCFVFQGMVELYLWIFEEGTASKTRIYCVKIMGWSCQLHGEKGLEGTTFHNACTQKGNSSTKSLAYTTLVRPILEYRAACWDPYRDGQIYALDRVQKKRLNFHIIWANRTGKHWRSVER